MDKQHDTTAPAREALAAWDKLHDERESLNQNLDFRNDSAYHQPEGKLPAEAVRDLATAAVLLEQTNALIDRANERQSRRSADDDKKPETDAARIVRDQKIPKLIGDGNISPQRTADHMAAIDSQKHLRKAQTCLWDAEHLLEVLAVYLGESDSDECHRANMLVWQVDKAVGKALKRIERHETDHSNLYIAYVEQSRNAAGASGILSPSAFDRIQAECEKMTSEECAARLRKFNYDVSENLAADLSEDGYTVTKTWTRKGLRYFLAEREFMESLLPDEGGTA